MSNLGKCLLFYLKYSADMERLYEADKPKVEGLPDPETVLNKVRHVGDTANREAAELLDLCGPAIEDRFRSISAVRRKRNNVELTWDLEFRICAKRAAHRRFLVGVGIDPEKPALIPWVWCRGGQRAEDEMVQILGRWIKSDRLGLPSGLIGLTDIHIPVPENWEEAVACAPLVAQVREAFAFFTAQEVKAIISLASD
jgi:hypothetical protein